MNNKKEINKKSIYNSIYIRMYGEELPNFYGEFLIKQIALIPLILFALPTIATFGLLLSKKYNFDLKLLSFSGIQVIAMMSGLLIFGFSSLFIFAWLLGPLVLYGILLVLLDLIIKEEIFKPLKWKDE